MSKAQELLVAIKVNKRINELMFRNAKRPATRVKAKRRRPLVYKQGPAVYG